MKAKFKRLLIFAVVFLFLSILTFAVLSVFFDEAVIVRKGTFYHAKVATKEIALTFDDGPSPLWTPKILNELRKFDVKATFFMLGDHVEKYPEIAKEVSREGHEIGNHTYDHHVIFYYKDKELEKEIEMCEKAIYNATGKITHYFRPPKAWLTKKEKQQISNLGYTTVLWSLNSKDWVNFDDKYIVKYLLHNAHPGDIILFHDSGGVFGTEGGNRQETIKALPRLITKLRERGFKFVTLTQLLHDSK